MHTFWVVIWFIYISLLTSLETEQTSTHLPVLWKRDIKTKAIILALSCWLCHSWAHFFYQEFQHYFKSPGIFMEERYQELCDA